MRPLYILLCLVAGGLHLLSPAEAQVRASIRTRDTVLTVSSFSGAPGITRLSAASGSHAWQGISPERLITSVENDGRGIPIHWRFDPAGTVVNTRHARFVYRSKEPALRLIWEWEARDSGGPIEHRITIENLSNLELWLPLQPSLAFAWRLPNESLSVFSVEKGADTPSPEGVHRVSLPVGAQWYGESSTYAFPRAGKPREIVPYMAVERADGTGFYAGVEFSGRVRLDLKRGTGILSGVVGLNPEPGPYRTRLQPGERFETPTVFVGSFSAGADGAGNQLRQWERRVLGNPNVWRDPTYPVTVNNSWGSGVQVDEPLALRMIQDSTDLGLEMFHLDAGWYRGIGDWQPDPRKFPHGLAPIADAAHRSGIRFGLWIDWVQAGSSSEPGALNVRDPKVAGWMVSDLPADWKPEEYKGQTLDLGVPAVRDWTLKELERIVSGYHLDMLEHDGYLVAKGCQRTDHPHAAPGAQGFTVFQDAGFRFVESSNETDVSYHSTRAYYQVYEKLRREHPGLLFEICNDGGRMIDFGSAAHGDYFSATDTYDPLSNRRALYDLTYLLPAPMLESYIEKWPTPNIDAFRYMLRSGMMGWMSVMTDTTQWSAEQHAAAKSEIAFYKATLRPILRGAYVYHVSDRPDNVRWDGMEFYDPVRRRGALFAFRGSAPDDGTHLFHLRGLSPTTQYTIRSRDGRFPPRRITGSRLMTEGITLRMDAPFSSDVLLFETHNNH